MTHVALFKHRNLFLKGLEQIYSLFQFQEEAKIFFGSVLIVQNSTTLIDGISGTGKTELVHLLAKVFFSRENPEEMDFAHVSCTQDLTPLDVLYYIDLPKLMKGIELVVPRPIITVRFKSFSEIKRASTSLLNSLLPLLSERFALYRDQKFPSPDFVCILDANPHDSGSTTIPTAFSDRIDYSFQMPTVPPQAVVGLIDVHEENGIMNWDMLTKIAKPVMTSDQMVEVWQDVQKVEVTKEMRLFCALVAGYLQQCQYTNRSLVSPDYELPCYECSYRMETCAKLQMVPGMRFVKSLIKLAQARAWLRHSNSVSVEDLLYGLPYSLGHRLKIRSESARLFPAVDQWIKEELYLNGIRGKIPKWLGFIHTYVKSPSKMHELIDEFKRNDLAVMEFYHSIQNKLIKN
jgi:MoxR-like ATPase